MVVKAYEYEVVGDALTTGEEEVFVLGGYGVKNISVKPSAISTA